jgi:hypothetical protein
MKLDILEKMNRIPPAKDLQLLLAVLVSGWTSKSQESMDLLVFIDSSEQIYDFDIVSNGRDIIVGINSNKGRIYSRFLIEDGDLVDN